MANYQASYSGEVRDSSGAVVIPASAPAKSSPQSKGTGYASYNGSVQDSAGRTVIEGKQQQQQTQSTDKAKDKNSLEYAQARTQNLLKRKTNLETRLKELDAPSDSIPTLESSRAHQAARAEVIKQLQDIDSELGNEKTYYSKADRVIDILLGSEKDYAGNVGNALATAGQAYRELSGKLSDSELNDIYQANNKQIADAQARIDAINAKPKEQWTQDDYKVIVNAQQEVKDLNKKNETMRERQQIWKNRENREYQDELAAEGLSSDLIAGADKKVLDSATAMNKGLRDISDSLSAEGQEQLAKAKSDLGYWGRVGVDLASNMIQMGNDAMLKAIGVGGMVPLFARSAGGAAREARQEGASTNQQLMYGVASGTVEALTEKMFDNNFGIYGKGFVDDATEAFAKMFKGDKRRTAARFLGKMFEEGAEEAVSDIAALFTKTVIYNEDYLKETFGSKEAAGEWLGELWYDFLVGALIGGFGATGNIVNGENRVANEKLSKQDVIDALLGNNIKADKASRNEKALAGGKDAAQKLVDKANALISDGKGSNAVAQIRMAAENVQKRIDSGKPIRNIDVADLKEAISLENKRRGAQDSRLGIEEEQEAAPSKSIEEMSVEELNNYIDKLSRDGKDIREAQRIRNEKLRDESIANYSSISEQKAQATETPSEDAETQTDEMTPATAQESAEVAKNELNSTPTRNEKVNEVIDALLPQTKSETKVNAEEVAEEERKALLAYDTDVERQRRAEFANELRSDPEVAERYKSGTGEFTGVPIKERLDTLREAFSDYDVDYYISDGEIVEARNGLEYDTDEALPDSREEREAYKDATVDLLTRTNREEPASHVGTNKTSQMRELEAEQKAAWEASERAKEKRYPIKPPSSQVKNSIHSKEMLESDSNNRQDASGNSGKSYESSRESDDLSDALRADGRRHSIQKVGKNDTAARRTTDSGEIFIADHGTEINFSAEAKVISDSAAELTDAEVVIYEGSTPLGVNNACYFDSSTGTIHISPIDLRVNHFPSYENPDVKIFAVHETGHANIAKLNLDSSEVELLVHGSLRAAGYDEGEIDRIISFYHNICSMSYGDANPNLSSLAYEELLCNLQSGARLIGTPLMDAKYIAACEEARLLLSASKTSEESYNNDAVRDFTLTAVANNTDSSQSANGSNWISSATYAAEQNSSNARVRDAEEQRQQDADNYEPEEDDSWRSSATYEQSERFAEQDQKEAAEKAERDSKEAWENAQREFGAQHKDIVDASKKTTKAVSDFLSKNFSDVEEKDTSRVAQRDALNEYSAAVEHIGDGTLSHTDFQTYYTSLEENPGMADFFDEDTAKLLGTVIERGSKANETANPADVESYRKAAAEFSRKLHDSTQKAIRAVEDKKSFSDNITQNKSSKEFFNNASAFFNRWLKNPDAQFRFFGGYNTESNSIQYQTAEGINNAVRKDTSIRTRAAAIAAKMTSKAEYVDFARGKTKSNVKVDGYTLSMSEAVSYAMTYNTLKAQGGNYRVENAGGWVFNSKVSKVADVHQLYNECMKAIDSDPMAKEFMEVATEVFDYLSPFMKEASYRINGYETDMYSKGNYFPVIYGDGTAKSNQRNTQEVFDNRHFNERTKKAGGYINIRNAADVMSSYTNSAVNTIAWGELGQRLQMMNKDTTLGDGISSQVGALNNEYAIWMNNYINQMNGITDYTNESNGNKALRWARQHFTQGTLMFSPTVPIKQVSSYWSAAGILDFDVLAKTYKPKFGSMLTGKKGVDNIIEQSRLSGSLNPEISGGNEPAWFSKAKAKCKLLNQLANLTNIEDYGTIDNLYAASINQVMKNEPNLDTESTEFQEKVDDLFSEVVIRTQPIFTTRARAEYLTTNNEVVRLFSNFRTQQTQNLGNIATAIGEYQAAKANGLDVDKASKKLKNTLAGQAASYVSFAALGVIADMAMHKFKKYDKDEDDEEYDETKGTIGNISTEKVILNAIGKLGSAGFGTVPFGSDLWNLAYSQITRGEVDDFYGIGIGPLSTLEQSAEALGTFGKNLADGKFNPKEAYNALRYTTQAAGMPIHNLYLPVNAIVQYARDIADKEDRGMYDDLITEINDQVKADRKLRGAYESEVKAVGRAEGNGDKYTGWRTFEEAGIGYDDWLAAKNKHTELGSNKELSAGNKADRFNVWLRQQGYDDKHREFIQEEFGFYSQVRGESDKLDTWVALGLDSERALNFKDSISAEEARVNKANEGITNDDLKQHYRNIDKMMTVANAKATDKELDILAPEILGKNALGLYEVARDNGMSGKQAVQAFKELDTSEDSKAQQAEVYAYYKAHPELESFAIAIWNAYGWKTSWQAYKRKQK